MEVGVVILALRVALPLFSSNFLRHIFRQKLILILLLRATACVEYLSDLGHILENVAMHLNGLQCILLEVLSL